MPSAQVSAFPHFIANRYLASRQAHIYMPASPPVCGQPSFPKKKSHSTGPESAILALIPTKAATTKPTPAQQQPDKIAPYCGPVPAQSKKSNQQKATRNQQRPPTKQSTKPDPLGTVKNTPRGGQPGGRTPVFRFGFGGIQRYSPQLSTGQILLRWKKQYAVHRWKHTANRIALALQSHLQAGHVVNPKQSFCQCRRKGTFLPYSARSSPVTIVYRQTVLPIAIIADAKNTFCLMTGSTSHITDLFAPKAGIYLIFVLFPGGKVQGTLQLARLQDPIKTNARSSVQSALLAAPAAQPALQQHKGQHQYPSYPAARRRRKSRIFKCYHEFSPYPLLARIYRWTLPPAYHNPTHRKLPLWYPLLPVPSQAAVPVHFAVPRSCFVPLQPKQKSRRRPDESQWTAKQSPADCFDWSRIHCKRRHSSRLAVR